MSRALRAAPALLLVFPLAWLASAGPQAMGPRSLDLAGHIWTIWSSSQEHLLRSDLVAWPNGADLLPILGGWLDIFLGVALMPLVHDPVRAFNLVLALYVAVAGVGAWLLARELGASAPAALVAGLLGQLDGYLLHHALGGRTEQAGLGFVALALALALRARRTERAWLACGVAGALVVFVSWEHAFWLAAAMAWLTPFLDWDRQKTLRWAKAAALTAALAGPWALLFVTRSLEVRDADEGAQTLAWAAENSVALLAWAARGPVKPSVVLLLALLPMPWLGGARRLWWGVLSGLGVCLVLALGPAPGLLQAGDLASWGPWTPLQESPILGWFHTPSRLLVGFSLAAPVAAALLVDRWRWLAPLFLGAALVHAWVGAEPREGWAPPKPAELMALSKEEGALLDLPVVPPGLEAMRFQNLQMAHGRPIPHHMTLPHLTTEPTDALLADRPALRAFAQQGPGAGTVPDGLQEEVLSLRGQGYGFVVLHPKMYPEKLRGERQEQLQEVLGQPDLRWGGNWMMWRLE